MKKTRSDAKLLNLPEEQQAQLAEWLLSGMPYFRAREMVEKEFNLKTSLGALSAFWDEVCAPGLLARRQRAVSTADQIAEQARITPGKFDQATIDAIRQKAFELSISPQSAPGQVKALFGLLLKSRDQELKNKEIEIALRRLEMLEAQNQKARDALADKTLDPKAREARMKEIFGL